jgi:hypothetical protein
MGSAGGDHHVVDRGWEIPEERPQGGRIVSVEGGGAVRIERERCLLEAFGIAPGEDNAGAFDAGSPGGFQPDASATADDDDDLAKQLQFALGLYSSGCHGHDSSVRGCEDNVGALLAAHGGAKSIGKSAALFQGARQMVTIPFERGARFRELDRRQRIQTCRPHSQHSAKANEQPGDSHERRA